MRRTKATSSCQLLYAASESCSDLLYATRFFAPDPFLLLIDRGKKILVLSDLEIDRARRLATVDEILPLADIEKKLKEKMGLVPSLAQVVQFLHKKKKIHSVQIPFDFPAGLALELNREGVRLQVKQPPFFEQRQIKTPDEVRKIFQALQAAEGGMDLACQILRESTIRSEGILFWRNEKLTSEILKQKINGLALNLGYTAAHTIVACGEQCCDPHEEGSGPLRANRPIIVDVFPRSQKNGYWGDLTRTFVKGTSSPSLQRLFQAVEIAQKKAIRMMRPGVMGKEIHEAVLAYFNSQGLRTGLVNGRRQGFFHGTGHGVGLDIHEMPRIGPAGLSPLQEGQVVTVEPGLYYKGIGGVRLEDLLLITAKGSRNLTRFPKILEIP